MIAVRKQLTRRVAVVVLAVLAFAAPSACTAAAATGSAPTAMKVLGHSGQWLTDPSGRAVVLHGFNMVNKRPPYAPDAVGFGADDAGFLTRNGFNGVRLGVLFAGVEPTPGHIDTGYLDRIERSVNMLGRAGVYSLLDFHQDQYNEIFQGEGFPSWSVLTGGVPLTPGLGFPANYLTMPALEAAFDHLWDNAAGPGGVGLQDRYAEAWQAVAKRFAHNPFVLGYDLINEPWPGSVWPTCVHTTGCPAFDRQLGAFEARSIAAIRKADPGHLAFYEPNVLFDSGVGTNLPEFNDARLGMSFHDYCNPLLAAVTGGCQQQISQTVTNALNRSAATGDALVMTEFGSTDNLGDLSQIQQLAAAHQLSWLEWAYCGCDDPTGSIPTSIQALVFDPAQPPSGANVNTAKLSQLAQPYAQVVAGTPGSSSYDPATRTFTLSYSTRKVGGRGAFGPGAITVIATPAVIYSGGYRATVSGARVSSPPGAAHLVLAARPGATVVTVRVSSP